MSVGDEEKTKQTVSMDVRARGWLLSVHDKQGWGVADVAPESPLRPNSITHGQTDALK